MSFFSQIFALGAGVLFGYDALLGFSILKDRKITSTDQTTSGQNGVGAQQNGVGTIIIVLGSLDFYNLHFSFFQMVAM